MITIKYLARIFSTLAIFFTALLALNNHVFAHCDTLEGPVVQSAKKALESRDVTPVLKWVLAEDEEKIRAAFQKTLAVRSEGDNAKELADMYFFETLVRIHRAGEGAPYTGLKSGEDVDPAVALADQALETGSAEMLVDVLTQAMTNNILKHYELAKETQKHADDSVAEGREFTRAYVIFTHYAEELHAAIQGNADHHFANTDMANEHVD